MLPRRTYYVAWSGPNPHRFFTKNRHSWWLFGTDRRLGVLTLLYALRHFDFISSVDKERRVHVSTAQTRDTTIPVLVLLSFRCCRQDEFTPGDNGEKETTRPFHCLNGLSTPEINGFFCVSFSVSCANETNYWTRSTAFRLFHARVADCWSLFYDFSLNAWLASLFRF